MFLPNRPTHSLIYAHSERAHPQLAKGWVEVVLYWGLEKTSVLGSAAEPHENNEKKRSEKFPMEHAGALPLLLLKSTSQFQFEQKFLPGTILYHPRVRNVFFLWKLFPNHVFKRLGRSALKGYGNMTAGKKTSFVLNYKSEL